MCKRPAQNKLIFLVNVMLNKKNLGIAICVLAVLCVASAILTATVSEAFIPVLLFLGIGLLCCFLPCIDIIISSKPNLFVAGIPMILIGFVFLTNYDSYPDICIPLAINFEIVGWSTIIFRKKLIGSSEIRINKKVKACMFFGGIALILSSFLIIVLSYTGYLTLSSLGAFVLIPGIISFVVGFPSRKKKNDLYTLHTKKQNKPEPIYCTKCRKDLSTTPRNQIYIICGSRFCRDCKKAYFETTQLPKKICSSCKKPISGNEFTKINNQIFCKICAAANTPVQAATPAPPITCSVCGISLSADGMRIVDNTVLCNDCFLKKQNDKQADSIELTDGIITALRDKILQSLSKVPTARFGLAKLLWEDAASCFPNKDGFNWDGAWFFLDLNTHKISVDVATYPNKSGDSHSDSFTITSKKFNQIAVKYNMSRELQAFKNDNDWKKLFDSSLKNAISKAQNTMKQRKNEENTEPSPYSVKLQEKHFSTTPQMCFAKLDLKLIQKNKSSSVKLTVNKGNYLLLYAKSSHSTTISDDCSRTLSSAEAVWVEEQINNAIQNPDNSTWQSLTGENLMDIVIKKTTGDGVDIDKTAPIRKYSNLMDNLAKLVQYGSTDK